MTTSIISKYMKNILDEYFSENIFHDTYLLIKNDDELHNIISSIIIQNLSKKEKNYILNNMDKPDEDILQPKLTVFFNLSKNTIINNTDITTSVKEQSSNSKKRKLHDDTNQTDYKKLKPYKDITLADNTELDRQINSLLTNLQIC